MRKDSWFRGALLSVLFFALLIGGAPGVALAGLHDGCQVDGCTSKHRWTKGEKHKETCDAMAAVMGLGGGFATVGGMVAFFGGPAGMAVGGVLAGMGATMSGVFGAGYLLNGCWNP